MTDRSGEDAEETVPTPPPGGEAPSTVVRPHLSPLVYAVPVAAAVLAITSIQWHLYPRPPSRLARVGVRLVDGTGALLAALWPRRPLPQARRMGT